MIRKISFFIIIITLGLSCGNVPKARETTDYFYKLRIKHNYSEIANICSPEFLITTDTSTFFDFLRKKDSLHGKIISFRPVQTHYYKDIDSFPEFVTIKYRVLYENKAVYDSIGLIKKDDTYKILFFYE